jgi:hypothetical protein
MRKILFIIISILLLFSLIKAESTSPKPAAKCYHYNCWYYPESDFQMCDWEIEDCDGRAAEFPAV